MLSGSDLSRSQERTEGRRLCCQQKEDEVWHQGLESRASGPWFVASFPPSQTLPEKQLSGNISAYLCREGKAFLCWTCLLYGLAWTDTALPLPFHTVSTPLPTTVSLQEGDSLAGAVKWIPLCFGVVLPLPVYEGVDMNNKMLARIISQICGLSRD